jgi:5-formyltetrahydrofolate cyclo-ligase
MTLEVVKDAQTILLYWSLPDEVFTHDLVLRLSETKNVILPVVDGDNLIFRKFSGITTMTEGSSFGILEPSGDLFTDLKAIGLVITPGLAFDRKLNRLGRGKAYYDKFLADNNPVKIGICFSFQLFDEIPAGEMDIRMNYVVSDREIILPEAL